MVTSERWLCRLSRAIARWPGPWGCAGKHAQLLLSHPRRACALLLTLSVRQLVPAFGSPGYCSKSDSQEGKHLTEFKINSAMLVYFDEYFLIIFLCLSGVWLINASS